MQARFSSALGQNPVILRRKNLAFNQRTQNYKRKYPLSAHKCITVHNGYDEGDMAPFRDKELAEGYMQITNLGSMYGGRSPDVFLAALHELFDEHRAFRDKIRIISFNKEHAQLASKIAARNLDDVFKAYPRVSQQEAFNCLAASHVALLFGSDMEKVAMTTKVYEYAAMGKLIFALVPDGPVKDFVLKCKGLVCLPEDKEQIKYVLRDLITQYCKGNLGRRTVSAFATQFERAVLARQMADLFERACALSLQDAP